MAQDDHEHEEHDEAIEEPNPTDAHPEFEKEIFQGRSGDMPLHTPEAVGEDLATMHREVVTPGTGKKCAPNDYASIHWRALIPHTHVVVEDSRKFLGANKPKVFKVGHFDRIKCFDLILPQMRQGETSEVFCPEHLAYGKGQ